MSTEILENQSYLPREKTKRRHFFAAAFDMALWSYIALCSYKILYVRILLSERYPSFDWGQPLTALLFGVGLSAVLYFIPHCSVGRAIFKLQEPDYTKPLLRKPYVLLSIFSILLTFVAGLFITQVSITEFLSTSGLIGAKRIFTALLNPNWAIFNQALFAAIETIYMAFIATAFAIPIAFVISFFAARNLMNGSFFSLSVYSLFRLMLNLTRAIEPLVWAIIFSVWVGIGPFAGMLALCLHSIASLSKLYSEQIENINDGPIEAMTATGAHPVQVIWFGVVPQVVLPFLSFTIYRWDINVRMATVIGLVGGGGIGTLLMQYQGLAKWNEVGLLVMVIAIIVWVMDYASAKIREAIK